MFVCLPLGGRGRKLKPKRFLVASKKSLSSEEHLTTFAPQLKRKCEVSVSVVLGFALDDCSTSADILRFNCKKEHPVYMSRDKSLLQHTKLAGKHTRTQTHTSHITAAHFLSFKLEPRPKLLIHQMLCSRTGCKDCHYTF